MQPPRFDISVSLDRFLRLYEFRKELLLFHQQKNNAIIGTITAPTAAGAAMIAMLLEGRLEEPPCVIGGADTAARDVELAAVLEPAVAMLCIGEECDVRRSDGVLASTKEVTEARFDCEKEEASKMIEMVVGEVSGDTAIGGLVDDGFDTGDDDDENITAENEDSALATETTGGRGGVGCPTVGGVEGDGTIPGGGEEDEPAGGDAAAAAAAAGGGGSPGGVEGILSDVTRVDGEGIAVMGGVTTLVAGKDEVGLSEVPVELTEAISAGFRSWLSNGAVSFLPPRSRSDCATTIYLLTPSTARRISLIKTVYN
jgi:hypothetical protein